MTHLEQYLATAWIIGLSVGPASGILAFCVCYLWLVPARPKPRARIRVPGGLRGDV